MKTDFTLSFLRRLPAAGKSATGKEDATELHAGVVAQKLRFLEVLLFKPWLVTIPKEESGLDEAVADVRVPNPVSFMVQKLLIRDRREGRKRAQDVLYISDTLKIFYGAMESDLAPIWKELEATLHANQRKSVREGVRELFSQMNDAIREAAEIPNHKRDPEAILQLCMEGFEELFGEV
jgi:hypothetical protein